METSKTCIAIVGYRDFHDYNYIFEQFKEYIDSNEIDIKNVIIVSGGAEGVDKIAKDISKKHKTGYLEFPAYWEKYGKKAGPIRNEQIVKASDIVLAFRHSNSKGTKITINFTKKYRKVLKVYDLPEEELNFF